MFIVSRECLDLGLRAGALVFRDVRIGGATPELRAAIAAAVQAIRSRPETVTELRQGPGMRRLHEIFRQVGVRPRRQPSSVERLLEYVLKRDDLPAINNLVDAYNLISIRTGFSMGAHDLGRIAAPVELRLFRGEESFTPLGAKEAVRVAAGEFGYVDAMNRVLCRLDVLQADFSKVTAEARDVLLIVEGTAAHDDRAFSAAFDEALATIPRHCGGNADVVAFPT